MRPKFVLLLAITLVVACPAFADITVNFSQPVVFLSFYSSEPVDLKWSDGFLSGTVNSGYTLGAVTTVNDGGITKVTFSGTPDYYILDDFSYQVGSSVFTINFDDLAEGAMVNNQYAGWAGGPTFAGTGGNAAIILTYPDYNWSGYPYASSPNVLYEAGGQTPTPEPSSLVMLGSGLLAAAGVIRRKLSR